MKTEEEESKSQRFFKIIIIEISKIYIQEFDFIIFQFFAYFCHVDSDHSKEPALPSNSEESSESSSSESSEESVDIVPKLKPVFVNKKNRVTLEDEEDLIQKQEELKKKAEQTAEERRAYTLSQIFKNFPGF